MSQHSADPLMKKIVSKIVTAAEGDPAVPQPMSFPPMPSFEETTPYGEEEKAPLDEELDKAKALAPVPEMPLQDAESRTQELKATHEEEGLRRDIDTLAASLASLEEQYAASRAVTLQYEGLASQMQSKQRKLDKLQKKRSQTQERLVDENIEMAQQRGAAVNSEMTRVAHMPQGIAGSELF